LNKTHTFFVMYNISNLHKSCKESKKLKNYKDMETNSNKPKTKKTIENSTPSTKRKPSSKKATTTSADKANTSVGKAKTSSTTSEMKQTGAIKNKKSREKQIIPSSGHLTAGDKVQFTPHPNMGLGKKPLTGVVLRLKNKLTNDDRHSYVEIHVKTRTIDKIVNKRDSSVVKL
jgi:hypothetical protein